MVAMREGEAKDSFSELIQGRDYFLSANFGSISNTSWSMLK